MVSVGSNWDSWVWLSSSTLVLFVCKLSKNMYYPLFRDAPEATGDEPEDADFETPKVYEVGRTHQSRLRVVSLSLSPSCLTCKKTARKKTASWTPGGEKHTPVLAPRPPGHFFSQFSSRQTRRTKRKEHYWLSNINVYISVFHREQFHLCYCFRKRCQLTVATTSVFKYAWKETFQAPKRPFWITGKEEIYRRTRSFSKLFSRIRLWGYEFESFPQCFFLYLLLNPWAEALLFCQI